MSELRVIGKMYSDGTRALVANDQFPRHIEAVVTHREHVAALEAERVRADTSERLRLQEGLTLNAERERSQRLERAITSMVWWLQPTVSEAHLDAQSALEVGLAAIGDSPAGAEPPADSGVAESEAPSPERGTA